MSAQAFSGPVVIVGARGGTNIAESLYRGAQDVGIEARLCDIGVSLSDNRFLNALSWRLRDRRPPFPGRLTQVLSRLLATERPSAMVSVGLAAVERPIIEAWRAVGVPCLHYSTDDPWNPSLRARWHLDSLRTYDIVFTPRRRNMRDLAALPCRRVAYLPFGYDPHVLTPTLSASPLLGQVVVRNGPLKRFEHTSLFVGGADQDRATFLERFIDAGGDASLVGGYWDHWPNLRHKWLGHLPPKDVLALTRSAPVNIILVRRANRDGHTMRSFEAGATGACLLVEKTTEHHEIFGEDGDTVRFFSNASEAASIYVDLLKDKEQRDRLAQAVRDRIRNGRHSYGDRLQAMLSSVRTCGATRSTLPQ